MPKKRFRGYEITTHVLDDGNQQPVHMLRTGSDYGHKVWISPYFQLYPNPLKIRSVLRDTQQLAFREQGSAADTPTWEWQLVLHPNCDEQDTTELLICADNLIRNQETIKVHVTEGDHAVLNLDVAIA